MYSLSKVANKDFRIWVDNGLNNTFLLFDIPASNMQLLNKKKTVLVSSSKHFQNMKTIDDQNSAVFFEKKRLADGSCEEEIVPGFLYWEM